VRRLVACAGAVVVGLVIGELVLASLQRDRVDWRARELTAWCDHYRDVAVTDRDRIRGLVSRLSGEFPAGEWWLFSAGAADWDAASEVLAIQRELMFARPWFTRCAAGPLPDLPLGDAMPAVAHELVRYLEQVIAQIPRRDPEDPAQYVAPLAEPERTFLGI